MDLRGNFLDELEKKYNVFETFQGEIPADYFSKIFRETAIIMMNRANGSYKEDCEKLGKDPEELGNVILKKDDEDNLYMIISGNNNRTKIVIKKDDAPYEYYRKVIGFKMTEKAFLKEMEILEEKKFQAADLPKRFLKKEIPPFDGIAETATKDVIDYTKYLNDEYIKTISSETSYQEPETSPRGKNSSFNNSSKDYERRHDIIDFDKRKAELMRHGPFMILDFKGMKQQEDIMVFVYQREDDLVAFAEPISGESFSKIMFFDKNIVNTRDILEEEIRKKLEMTREEISYDITVVRSSHITIEKYHDNLEYLLADQDPRKIQPALSFMKNVNNASNKIKKR